MGNILSDSMRNKAFENSFTKIATKVFSSRSGSGDNEADVIEEFIYGVLPEDLMLEILKRLPSKSLMRFLSVSKAWHSLICSPSFIDKHRIYHHNEKFTGYLRRSKNNKKEVYWISKKIDDCHAKETVVRLTLGCGSFDSADMFCAEGLVFVRLFGWRRGLFSCKKQRKTIFKLWNPATRQLKHLPNQKTRRNWIPDGHEFYLKIDSISYVHRTRDYKLASFLFLKDKRSVNGCLLGRALMLNVAENNWRELENQELPCRFIHGRIVGYNSFVHFLAWNVSFYRTFLLSFDLVEERFSCTATALPYGVKRCWRLLTIYKGNLAVFVSPKYNPRVVHDDGEPEEDEEGELGNFFELWAYKNTTWSKQFTFGPLPRCRFPGGFGLNWEIIVRKNYYYRPDWTWKDAYLYNRFNKEKKVFPCPDGGECNLSVLRYQESLVQI